MNQSTLNLCNLDRRDSIIVCHPNQSSVVNNNRIISDADDLMERRCKRLERTTAGQLIGRGVGAPVDFKRVRIGKATRRG